MSLVQSYLLRGFGTGRGSARRFPARHRTPRRWACTGFCCPTWACLPPPPPPSCPGPNGTVSSSPDPGWGASASCWAPVLSPHSSVWKRWLLSVSSTLCVCPSLTLSPLRPHSVSGCLWECSARGQWLCVCWPLAPVAHVLSVFFQSWTHELLCIVSYKGATVMLVVNA